MGLRVSPVGWGVAALAVLGLVLGRWFGWLELGALGASLVAVLVVSLLMTAGRARYAVTLDMADRRVKVGERALGRVEVRNTARRRSLPSRIELPVGTTVAELPGAGAGAGRHPRRHVRHPDGPPRRDRGRAPCARCVATRSGSPGAACAGPRPSRSSCTRSWSRSPAPARVCCGTSRDSRRATCPTPTCRSTRCVTTSRATTGGTSTGGPPHAAAASWSSSSRTPAARRRRSRWPPAPATTPTTTSWSWRSPSSPRSACRPSARSGTWSCSPDPAGSAQRRRRSCSTTAPRSR